MAEKTINMLNVRVELRGELLKKFLKIQSRLGIGSATEVVRYLITDYYLKNVGSEGMEREEKKALEKEVGGVKEIELNPGGRIVEIE